MENLNTTEKPLPELSKLTTYPAPLTSEEDTAVKNFTQLLTSKNISYNSNKFNESYLVRFLKARKLDLNKALEMFTDFLEWRKKNEIDQIELTEFPELFKIKTFYPHGFHKTDRQGRPIYIEIIGELKLASMLQITTSERLLQYQVQEYERLIDKIFPVCSHIAGKNISQTFTIIDLKKLNAKLLSKNLYEFLKLTSTQSQNFYPEILGQLYIINSGLLFKAAWAVCKSFVDEKTRKKISTFGSDYKKKLFEIVDPKNLPKSLGGECVCEPYGCMFSDAGPWNYCKQAGVKVDKELLKQSEVELDNNDGNDCGNDKDNQNETEEDEENKERLAELSKQLSEGMNLSKGQAENTKFKFESGVDSETPVNTQEGENENI